MSITQLDYAKNTYEAITDETLDNSPVLNTWYHFKIDGWKHLLSDIVLKQAGTPLPGSAYELTTDTKYTDYEENESGKTIYAMWRIVDGTYDLIATTVSGNNFGTYVSNEGVNDKIPTTAADISYDNTASGLTAIKTQTAIDELAIKTGVYARIASTSTQNITTGTFTPVIYGTEDIDELSEYDNTTGLFTADGDGWRDISTIVSWAADGATPAGVRIVSLYLNGIRLDKGREILVFSDPNQSGWYMRMNLSLSMYLSDGDTIEINVYQSSGNTLALQGSTLSIRGN